MPHPQPIELPKKLRGVNIVGAMQVLSQPCCRCRRHLDITQAGFSCRACGKKHAPARRQSAASAPPRRRPVVVMHRRPVSTPRPRESRARVVPACRHGNGEKGDGSGGDDDGGDSDLALLLRGRIAARRNTKQSKISNGGVA